MHALLRLYEVCVFLSACVVRARTAHNVPNYADVQSAVDVDVRGPELATCTAAALMLIAQASLAHWLEQRTTHVDVV
jgi:hypothetical protein